jgi:uncharacterized RDD family membrane protein YckC
MAEGPGHTANPYRAPETRAERAPDLVAEPEVPVPAHRWQRIAAGMIDACLVICAYFASLVLTTLLLVPLLNAAGVPANGFSNSGLAGVAVVLWGLFVLFYYPLLESSPAQGTLGKIVLAIRVVDARGRRIAFGRAFLRTLAKILFSLPYGIGSLWLLVSRNRRAMHDIVAGTLVVRASDSLDAYERARLDQVIADFHRHLDDDPSILVDSSSSEPEPLAEAIDTHPPPPGETTVDSC